MNENKLRKYLWLSHGHFHLYGDDGEMQCQDCIMDYKRDDLDILLDRAIQAREEINLKELKKVNHPFWAKEIVGTPKDPQEPYRDKK